VDRIAGKKRRRIAGFADASAAQCHDLIPMNDSADDAWELVFFGERAKGWGEITRRGRTVGGENHGEQGHESDADWKLLLDVPPFF
jgi:hypothetical protein